MVADDRGQVLLIGGLAVAIVFLTAIPLSNSLVVSESASTSDTVADIDRAAEREASVERGLARVLASVDTTNTTAVNNSLQNFTRTYANVSGQQDGVYVNATVNVDESRGGVVNGTDDFRKYSGGGNQQNWDLVSDTETISEFSMWLNQTNSGNPTFEVIVSGSSGDEWRVELSRGTGSNSPKTVEIIQPDGSTETCTSTGDIRLDLKSGTCTMYTGTGSPTTVEFTSFSESLSEPYDIRFERSNNVNLGRYRLAAVGDFDSGSLSAVVVPAVKLQYVGPDTSYTRTILVEEES